MPNPNGAAAVLLCIALAASPFSALAQDISLTTNVVKNIKKTTNVNGNGNVVGGTVIVGELTNNNNGGSVTNNNGGNTGSGTGDPLIQAFDGSRFFFHGEPGKIYNMITDDASYQVAALLKEANNAVHIGSSRNGTYMQAIGFTEEDVRVSIETFADDSARMVVKVNDEELSVQDMMSLKNEKSFPLASGGFVNITFSLFSKRDGTVVYIVTPLVSLGVSLVPPGMDHAGFWQPSYLNLNATLLANPKGVLQVFPRVPASKLLLCCLKLQTQERVWEDELEGGKERKEGVSEGGGRAGGLWSGGERKGETSHTRVPRPTYELTTLFSKPQVVFSAQFLRAVIAQRRAIALRLFRASTQAE
eukprot:jgi/Botrbrau1/4339/Bobra.0232s0028.1